MTSSDSKEIFKARVRDWAEKLDVPVRSVTVRPLKSKWASYATTGRLTFDSQLPDLAETLQDSVIVHELLHFRIRNHGRLWKSLMRSYLGDYQRDEEKLRDIAAKMGRLGKC